MSLSRRAFVGGMSASLVACAAPRQSWSKTTADVIVIGAGLSGLNAAAILENAGLKVILLEGNNRTGGRLYTLDQLPGSPDAGGIQIGASYKRFHDIANRLGVERYVPPQYPRGSLYNIGGQSLTAAQWPKSSANLLAEAEKSTTPDALFFKYLSNLPKFEKVTDWMKPDAADIDIPLESYLKSQGASGEALRLMNANLNGNSISEQSALHMARSLAIFRAGGPGATQFVRGGSQRMTDAMTSALRSEVILNANVAAIEDEGDGVEVSLSDGRKFGARNVVCTIPFAAMRSVKIESDLPPFARQLISTLPYTKASFAYLQASEPFWKSDGFPNTIWSDDPLLGRVFVLGEDPAMLKVWVNGPDADTLDAMKPEDAGAAIIRKIEATRPSAKGKLKLIRVFSWQTRFAQGIYHHIGAGQGAALAATSQYESKRIHFAGEHLAQESSGIEGALESGERAAGRILRR